MAIFIDGPNSLITLSSATSFNCIDIYDAIVNWSALSGNMQYTMPMTAAGKAPLGGGVYTDIAFTLVNGWKLSATGYPANTTVFVIGTIVTSDGSSRVAAGSENNIQWQFQLGSFGVIIDEQIPTVAQIVNGVQTDPRQLTVGKYLALK